MQRDISDSQPRYDLGYFGPKSMTWRIHGSPLALIGGIRALMIQSTEPRSLAAVVQSAGFRDDAFGRFQRTSAFVGITTFGERRDADAAVRKVKAIHTKVKGTDPITNLPYDANSPILSAFVHNALVESMAVTAERFNGGFRRGHLDAYVREMTVIGRLMGAPDSELPESYQELRRWVGEFPMLTYSAYTASAFQQLEHFHIDPTLQPLYLLYHRAALSSLPQWLKDDAGVRDDLILDNVLHHVTRVVGLMGRVLLPSSPSVVDAKARMHANWLYDNDRVSTSHGPERRSSIS